MTPSWYSKPSRVSSRFGRAITPALLRRTWSGLPWSSTAALKSLIEAREERSSREESPLGRETEAPGAAVARTAARAALALTASRQPRTTS